MTDYTKRKSLNLISDRVLLERFSLTLHQALRDNGFTQRVNVEEVMRFQIVAELALSTSLDKVGERVVQGDDSDQLEFGD